MVGNHILKRKVVDKSVYDLSIERLHYVYDLFDTIVVAFSGGKDSTVLLNLTLQVARERKRLPLIAQFHDEECIGIAARGDLKGRRQEYSEIAGRDDAELRAKYDATRKAEGL